MSVVALRSVVKARVNAPQFGTSWTALLASTTIGLDPLERRRVHVSCDPWLLKNESYRVLVHTYDALSNGENPESHSRPRASVQRAVTVDELRAGVDITLHEPIAGSDAMSRVVIVAWIELGEPNLDYDGAEASPAAATYLGRTEVMGMSGGAEVVLRHQDPVRHQAA